MKRYETNVRVIIIHEHIDTKTHSITNVEVANVMIQRNDVLLTNNILLIRKVLRGVAKS